MSVQLLNDPVSKKGPQRPHKLEERPERRRESRVVPLPTAQNGSVVAFLLPFGAPTGLERGHYSHSYTRWMLDREESYRFQSESNNQNQIISVPVTENTMTCCPLAYTYD